MPHDADEALRQLEVTVIPGGVGNTEDQVEVARRLGVTGYIGTPSFLLALIQRAEKMGYDFQQDFDIKTFGFDLTFCLCYLTFSLSVVFLQ